MAIICSYIDHTKYISLCKRIMATIIAVLSFYGNHCIDKELSSIMGSERRRPDVHVDNCHLLCCIGCKILHLILKPP